MRLNVRLGLMALLMAAAPAFAAGTDWSSLSTEQQAVLAPALKGGAEAFNALPEARRQKLAEGASRWLAMDAAQRQEASQQFDTWQNMSNSERRAALERRDRFRQLPRAEQESLLQQHRRFKALAPLDQQRLRDAFQLDQHRIDPLDLPSSVDGLLPPVLPAIPTLPPVNTSPSPATPSLLTK